MEAQEKAIRKAFNFLGTLPPKGIWGRIPTGEKKAYQVIKLSAFVCAILSWVRGGLGRGRGSSWGILPQTPFSRFARRAAIGRALNIRVQRICSYRTSWGSLPQPPFSRFDRHAVVGSAPSLLHIWLKLFLFGGLPPGKNAQTKARAERDQGGKYKQ
jgi:hypothetical protein